MLTRRVHMHMQKATHIQTRMCVYRHQYMRLFCVFLYAFYVLVWCTLEKMRFVATQVIVCPIMNLTNNKHFKRMDLCWIFSFF